MSLNWEWTDKMGEVIYEDDRYDPEHPYTTNIYQGNALITSLVANANNGENATYNITLTGVGKIQKVTIDSSNG